MNPSLRDALVEQRRHSDEKDPKSRRGKDQHGDDGKDRGENAGPHVNDTVVLAVECVALAAHAIARQYDEHRHPTEAIQGRNMRPAKSNLVRPP